MAIYYAQIGDDEFSFEVTQAQEGTIVTLVEDEGEARLSHIDFAPVHFDPDTGEGLYSVIVDGKSYQLYVEKADVGYRVAIWRHRFDVKVLTERERRLMKVAPRQTVETGPLVIKAPMPGMVKSVWVADGDIVKLGQRLLVLEAMKMENDIKAPRNGRVSKVHVEPDTAVEGGKPLVTLRSRGRKASRYSGMRWRKWRIRKVNGKRRS